MLVLIGGVGRADGSGGQASAISLSASLPPSHGSCHPSLSLPPSLPPRDIRGNPLSHAIYNPNSQLLNLVDQTR